MTDYPPQGPGYGQGSGAGWDQGGQYGRSGPGQGGSVPGQGGYGTQGGQYGQPTWGAPPPPDHNRRNTIIAAVVAVLVLGGGIGSLVLFSGKGDDKQAQGSGSPTPTVSQSADFPTGSTDPTGSTPDPSYSPLPTTSAPTDTTTSVPSYVRETATLTGSRYFTELRNHSLSGIKQLVCAGVPITLTETTVNSVTLAYASGDAAGTGSTATVEGIVRTASERFEIVVTVRQEDGKWCISRTRSTTSD